MIVTPREPAGATGVTVTANDAGVATIPGLKPGRYAITAEFAGFDAGELADVRLRAGDNKQQIELALTGFTDTVEVGLDPQSAAADPNSTLATELTDEEIEALSDDPSELMRQLVEMAGGSARVRVDGFNGGSLPSRDVIRSIRIVRDTFPAENHSAENDGIDIITRPASAPFAAASRRACATASSAAATRSSTSRRPSARRTSTSISAARSCRTRARSRCSWAAASSSIRRSRPTRPTAGKQSQLLGRRPNDGWNVNGMFDYALTKEQMLRVGYSQNYSSRSNLGIGGFDLAERAYCERNDAATSCACRRPGRSARTRS